MICLKNRTFAVSQTTGLYLKHILSPLWFAWKIVLLQYRKQPVFRPCSPTLSCDLLEKSYFCSIANSLSITNAPCVVVVICLKNRTFAVSQTANYALWQGRFKLWFAWKIVLLQYRKQQTSIMVYLSPGCDLLEKSYFCSIANSNGVIFENDLTVVICLKNRTFAVSQTAEEQDKIEQALLWFAWKIVLLQYRKQLCIVNAHVKFRCDLLEKSYFCSIANSGHKDARAENKLWFAWKIVLLQYRKQQATIYLE